tara:strand:+ start:1852 stop:2475 length:624 start_codon:yes stop_codon:yes gene_type:complete
VNLINKKFKEIEDLNSNIFKEILSLMEVNKSPHLILSGGNSPKHLFKIISQNKEYFKEATFLMSDERIVDTEDPNSNEGEFIRFSTIPRDNLISLHDRAITQKLKNISSYDIAILGMGEDGHFASIFPDCKNTSKALNSHNNLIEFDDAHLNFSRKSLSLNEILKSKKIILIASSKTKQSILKYQRGLPVHYLLKRSSNRLCIFSCD